MLVCSLMNQQALDLTVGFALNLKKASQSVTFDWLFVLVGTVGFELTTPCTPCKCATRLRYAPKNSIVHEACAAFFKSDCFLTPIV